MELKHYILLTSGLYWICAFNAVSAERQRADMEIPPPEPIHLSDEPIPSASMTTAVPLESTIKKTEPPTTTITTTTTTTSSSTTITTTAAPSTPSTSRLVEVITSKKPSSSNKPTEQPVDTTPAATIDKGSYNKPRDSMARSEAPTNVGLPAEKSDIVPSIQAVKPKPSSAGPDELSYIIAGSVAGGVALIGGVAMVLGVLVYQGKVGARSGFTPVATSA